MNPNRPRSIDRQAGPIATVRIYKRMAEGESWLAKVYDIRTGAVLSAARGRTFDQARDKLDRRHGTSHDPPPSAA
jgi:hypothetical protein